MDMAQREEEVYKVEDLPKDIRDILQIDLDWMNQATPLPGDTAPPLTMDDFFTYDFSVRFKRTDVQGYKFILIWADPIKDEGGPHQLIAHLTPWDSIANITFYFDTDLQIIYRDGQLQPQVLYGEVYTK